MYGFLPSSTRAYAGTIDGSPAKEILVRMTSGYGAAVDGDIQGRWRSPMRLACPCAEIVLGFAIEVAALRLRRARPRQAGRRPARAARSQWSALRSSHRVRSARPSAAGRPSCDAALPAADRPRGSRARMNSGSGPLLSCSRICGAIETATRIERCAGAAAPLGACCGSRLHACARFAELLIEILDLPLQHAAQFLRRILSEQTVANDRGPCADRRPAAPRCCRTTAPSDDWAPSRAPHRTAGRRGRSATLRPSAPALRRGR